LQAYVETLKQQLEQQRTDHQAERERLISDVDRLNAELGRERAHARDLAGRLDAAHREALEYARLPWWRKLMRR